MERFTKPIDQNRYCIADENIIQHDMNGYSGEAVNRLARFEDIVDDLQQKQEFIAKEMDQLRAEGKTNTIRFKQNLANKLLNSQILALFESYGCLK